jgi:uncharacterized protein (TIGR03083 family)
MSDQEPLDPTSKAELIQKMEIGWADLDTFIRSLTPAQLTQPTDAAGWTVKDHLIHLVPWQDGISAILEQQGETRAAAMGLDAATWGKDMDEVNAIMQQQSRDLPMETVLERLQGAHQRMLKVVMSLPEEALFYPYKHYDPTSTYTDPIIGWIVGDGYEHYAEHIPWMQAIVSSA